MPFAALRRAARGALLLVAGDPATSVYMVRRGQVRVFLLSEDGRETTTAVLGPGQIVGISPLLGRPTHHAFVQALTPVEVWAMPADELRQRMAQDPALCRRIATALARRLSLAETLVGDTALLPVRDRIRHAVEHLQPCLGQEHPRLTREVIAKLVGARRESVSRAVGKHQAVPA